MRLPSKLKRCRCGYTSPRRQENKDWTAASKLSLPRLKLFVWIWAGSRIAFITICTWVSVRSIWNKYELKLTLYFLSERSVCDNGCNLGDHYFCYLIYNPVELKYNPVEPEYNSLEPNITTMNRNRTSMNFISPVNTVLPEEVVLRSWNFMGFLVKKIRFEAKN